MTLRDVATQFVSDVLRDVTIHDQHLTSKLDLKATLVPILSLPTSLAHRDVAARFVSGVLHDITIREQQVVTKVDAQLNLAPVASEVDPCFSKVSAQECASRGDQQPPGSAHDSEAEQVAITSISDDVSHQMQGSITAEMIQTFASEVVATAIKKAAVSVGANRATGTATDSKNSEAPQPAAEEKESSSRPQQQSRPVSRRQLIHEIAKATNDHVLSIVLQDISSSLPVAIGPHPATETSTAPVDQIYENDEDVRVPAPSSPDVHSSSPPTRLAAEEEVDPEQMPSLELHVDDQPPPTNSTADASIQNQVANAFVHSLLLQASTVESHPKPRISVQSPPLSADHETSALAAHSRRKSPNVYKRNLVKKNSVPSSPLATQPSPPPPEKPVPDDASSLTATDPTQDQAKPKQTGKRDPRPKHHPHKTHEKATCGDDTSTLEAIASVQTTKFKLALSLEDKPPLFSATSSPLSSARLAQESYHPHNPIVETSPSPLVLKKPTARAHPRRHPHHIQNAAIAKVTSYSRDSPRADAIASELQKKSKVPPSDAAITSQLLLPLTVNKAPTIPAATIPPQQPPTHSPKKQFSRDNKNVSRSPAKMRSGFCQQCVFEGRSCKINDCLKHQLLK